MKLLLSTERATAGKNKRMNKISKILGETRPASAALGDSTSCRLFPVRLIVHQESLFALSNGSHFPRFRLVFRFFDFQFLSSFIFFFQKFTRDAREAANLHMTITLGDRNHSWGTREMREGWKADVSQEMDAAKHVHP